jgi:hypothetical protein
VTSPVLDDGQMPYPHNPIEYLPRINPQVQVHVFQFRAGLAERLAQWMGGTVSVTEDGAQLVTIDGTPPTVAGVGDYVLSDGARFWIEPGGRFSERYWPVGRDPGWDHVCTYRWEQ